LKNYKWWLSLEKIEKLVSMEYLFYKRIIMLILFLVIAYFGVILILLWNVVTITLGIVLIIISLLRIFDLIFFKEIIINKNNIIKKWYLFGKISIPLKNLEFISVHRKWTSNIFFKNTKFNFVQNLFTSFELFPVILKYEKYKELIKLLENEKVIKREEHEWNN